MPGKSQESRNILMRTEPRIALVVSHPIQHFCPQYVSFAANVAVTFKVFFASTLGYRKYMDVNFNQEISWGNLELNKFDHVFLNGDTLLPSNSNIDAPLLDKALIDYGPDLVIIYGYFQKLQRRAHRWASHNRVRIAYISDSELRHHRNRLLELVKYLWIRKYFSKISFFLSVGNANEEFYRRYGVKDNQLLRMHFPIDFVKYERSFVDREALRKEIRSRYGIGESEIVVAVVGKLTPWKNQEHIIEALRLLEAASISIRLFVLGSGEQMDALKGRAATLEHSQVHLVGFVNIDQLPAYYAATDIYVHPSSIEPHSIAVSEAIYMGCPVIVSDRSGSYGPNDDVQEGLNGFVYQFGDISQLAQKIKILVKDEQLRQIFGLHSHKIAMEFQNKAHTEVLRTLRNRLTNELG